MILDASVVIAIFDNQDTHHAAAVSVVADSPRERLLLHELTLAESLVVPVRLQRASELLRFLDQLGVEIVGPAGLALSIARLRAATGLKMPDCVVLATAEELREPVATVDARLSSVARDRGTPILPTQ